ncbi:MAG: flagellar hook-associated protein FlgL [Mariprofundus sp.]|nr:flagellar hook-associated protein FlgL [Mariprofundus sp.]
MRVTTSQLYNTLLSGVKRQQEAINTGNAQISSGMRFQTPTQGGTDYKISLDIRQAQTSMKGDLSTVNTADTRLTSSLSLLNDMGNILKRAQTVAVQMSTSGISPAERTAASAEATQLLNQFLNDTNQKWQGQSLFAGAAVDKPAYSLSYTAGANTSISNVTQTANPSGANDNYAITLDAAGTSIASITNSAGTNLLAAPAALTAGANTATLSNGVALNLTYSGTPVLNTTAAGTLNVTASPPAGAFSYTGSAQDRTVTTSDGRQIISNIRGDNQAFTDAFAALSSFKTALIANDTAGVQAALGTLTTAGDGIINVTSEAGAKLSGIRLQVSAIQDRQLNLQTQLSAHETADIPLIVATMQQSTIALQAAYSQIAQVKTLSLTNFLR